MAKTTQISDCVFCKIIAGELESSKIYEDEKILAFMNIRPVHPGEFMIIPKEHIDHFLDIPDDLATYILINAQKLARKVQERLGPKRIGYVVHGFGVPHAHLNVVPLHHAEDIVAARSARIEGGKIIFGENHIPITPREELDRIAKLIRGK